MSNYSEKFDSETRQVINYLKSKNEICDFYIKEYQPCNNDSLNEWEIKNFCSLPQDLKSFYQNHDGFLIEWSFKLDGRTPISLGKLQINSLKDLTKVGSVLFKDYKEPSIFDLEDLQEPPIEFLKKLESDEEKENLINHDLSNDDKTVEIVDDFSDEPDEIANNKSTPNSRKASCEENKLENVREYDNIKTLIPHFDDSSRNFELDNCGGYGKVCLVYRNTKAGLISSEQSAEIWFLDRSLQWYYLTNSFSNYYRLMISHLGLPQWQMLFTQDGLPPYLYQWYYLLTPGRIIVHENNWKNLEFLSILENNTNNNTSSNSTNSNSNVNNTNNNSKKQDTQREQQNIIKKRIDFSKLFDDKQSKNKTQNSNNTIYSTENIKSNNSDQQNKNVPRSRSKPNINRTTNK